MEIHFTKMEGAGNDYVFIDGFLRPWNEELGPEAARRIADRHFGVGSDGLIVLAPSERATCRMLMWNADGSRGQMCGNGVRCLAKLARDVGVSTDDAFEIETDAGLVSVELIRENGAICGARVDLGAVRVKTEGEVFRSGHRAYTFHRADAGNPHAVIFFDENPDGVPVGEIGRGMQADPRFPEGVNVEFVQLLAADTLVQRTFERGSGETLACGSGATAAAGAAWATGRSDAETITVRLKGGELRIQRRGSSLVMEGPARTVFSGVLDLDVP